MKEDNIKDYIQFIKDISKQNEKDINHDKITINNITNKYY